MRMQDLSALGQIGTRHTQVVLARELMANRREKGSRLVILEGSWAYEKIIAQAVTIRTCLVCPELIVTQKEKGMAEALAGIAINAHRISPELCRRLSQRDKPMGIFLLCELPPYSLRCLALREQNLVLVLAGLDKPGNIGTVIRAADGAGCDGVILCGSHAKITHPQLVKASMGAVFTTPVVDEEQGTVIQWLRSRGFRIMLADAQATQLYDQADYAGRIALVFGNENHGLDPSWYACCDARVAIPMRGGCDSLNVGLAAGIIAYTASMRQRRGQERSLPGET